MPSIPGSDSGEHFVKLLKKLFEALSATAPQEQYCADCGALLGHMDTQFWFDGEDQAWNVLMPCCLHCNPELAARMTFAA